MTTELGPPGAKMSTVSRAGFGGRGPSKLVAGGIWSQKTDNNKAGDKEVLHPSSERFRMKLIRDFRLLENLTEMEAGLEAPKYHASDITEKPKREKLLSDNPNALVKFNTVSRRIENPKYEKLNEVQSQRLHRIKYRLATIPPLKYLANNVVESKKFKRIIKFIVYLSTITLIIKTSLVVEYERGFEKASNVGKKGQQQPLNFDYFILSKTETDDARELPFRLPTKFLEKVQFVDKDNNSHSCIMPDADFLASNPGHSMKNRSVTEFLVTYPDTASIYRHGPNECRDFVEATHREIWFEEINQIIKVIEWAVGVVFTLEVIFYWMDDFHRYWQSWTKTFDFVITLTCIFQLGLDVWMSGKSLEALEQDPSYDDVCVNGNYLQFGTSTLNMTSLCAATEYKELLYVILRRQKLLGSSNDQFLGSPIRRYCESHAQDTAAGWVHTYLCGVSDPYQISCLSLFGYYGIFTIFKAMRLMKVLAFSNDRVLEIIGGVLRAMSQMYLILTLMIISLTLFSLLFNTMFKEKTSSDYADFYTRRNVPAKWTYGELESKIVENLENWNEEKKSVFVGFIDIWWTLAILFQMMTLDQWADTFKQVQTAHFGPILVSADKPNASFCEFHNSALQGFFGIWHAESWSWIHSFQWFCLFMFMFLWLYMGNFIFKNLITGVVVNNILQSLNEKRWEECEAKIEKELTNIAGEIEQEVKDAQGDDLDSADNLSQATHGGFADTTEETSWNRIQEIERNSEYMRENIYKPWRWACFQRCCPQWLKTTAFRVSTVKESGKKKMKKIANRVRLFSFSSKSSLEEEESILSKKLPRPSPTDRNHPKNRINTHSSLLGSLTSDLSSNSNEGQMKFNVQAPSLLDAISVKSGHSTRSFTSGFKGHLKSQGSALSFGTPKNENYQSESTFASGTSFDSSTAPNDSDPVENDYDITQWELAVQVHMDKINGYPKEALWPRDTLFKYYQAMERLQENVQERKEIIKLFAQSMIDDHDT